MMRMGWMKKMRMKNMKTSMKKINKKFLVGLKSSLKRKTQKTTSTQTKMWMNFKILPRKRKVKNKALEGLQIRKKHKNKRLKVFAASLSSKMMKMRTITPHPEMWRKTLTQARMPVLWT
jgi:hypothetical protein